MQRVTLFLFAVLVTVALAGGQYYVPRSYYTIDADGHQSAPIPLRRLRRSFNPHPYPYQSEANANANAEANSWGGNARANANANANAGGGGSWSRPGGPYGAVHPTVLSSGQTRRQTGPIYGARGISAGSSVGIDSTGQGYYDQYTSVTD
ncbi:uncharacterized protein LOC126966400 [Leptidea sinapis]|uniref:uncharacterized protein LOC126966400 n=1 Tax=Leptidea sinapis TaxID=189913 RepID=UPI002137D86D|nr:uncharacterized protein LOC126966400 [Leptidea sinapis]